MSWKFWLENGMFHISLQRGQPLAAPLGDEWSVLSNVTFNSSRLGLDLAEHLQLRASDPNLDGVASLFTPGVSARRTRPNARRSISKALRPKALFTQFPMS